MTVQTHLFMILLPEVQDPWLEVKLLEPKLIREGTDCSDLGDYRMTVVIPYNRRNLSLKVIKDALSTAFSRNSCRHDYDCCGCRCDYPMLYKMRRVRRGVYTFPVANRLNY